MMHAMMDGQGHMPMFGWVMMLLFWSLVIFGIIFVVRWFLARGRTGGEAGTRETPLDIVKRRYAKGEITKEEFERLKNDLR